MNDLTLVRHAPSSAASSYDGLLACLAPRDWDLLARDFQRVSLDRDQILSVPGAAMPWVHFPQGTTMAALSTPMADGRATVTGAITRDGAIGLMEAVADGRSLSRVVVVMPGPTVRIAAPKLAAAARRSSGLRVLLGRYGQELAGQAMQLAACSALHTVKHRICRWILTAHDCMRDGAGLIEADMTPLPLTQETLGEALGVQRTTVTVAAMRLQQEGLVRYGRGRVFVLDRPGLEQAACECHGVMRRRRHRLLAEGVAA